MFAVFLALTASFCWGSSDWLAGSWTRRTSLLGVLLVSQITGLILTAVLTVTHGQRTPGISVLLPGVLAGLISIVALAALYKALSIGIMSIVAPLSTTGVIIPLIVGLVRGERPGAAQALGTAVAIAGIMLASSARSAGARPAPSRSSIGFALLAAAAIGTAYVLMAQAAAADPAWGVFTLRVTAAVVVGAVILTRRPALRLTLTSIPALVMVGLGENVGNALFSLASTQGYLSVVAVLGYVYPVFTVLLAHAFSGERLAPWQLVGAGAALAGAAAIATG